jgi:cell cycle checkpoint protein
MDYPNDREVLETVHCAEPVSFRFESLSEGTALVEPKCSYRVGHIARAQRALQNSSKTSLRIGIDGTMNMQFLVSSPFARGGASEAFISFRVNHIYLSLTAIDMSNGFSVSAT